MMKRFQQYLVPIAIVLAVLFVGIAYIASDKVFVTTATSETLSVYRANNSIEHRRGLSGRDLKTFGADGMLFLYGKEDVRYFWMKGMKFNLDVVWIRDKKIVKIDRNLPPQQSDGSVTRMDSVPFEVDAVLELPAGSVDMYGLFIGQDITY